MGGDAVSYPLVKISEFCKTGSGGTPSRTNLEFYDGDIPWIKSGELRESIITTTSEFITENAVKKSSAKIVPKGAILLAMYGATVGRMAMLGIDAATNQAVCNIVPDENIAFPRYVYYALSNKVPYFLNNAVGGAQPNISQGMIKDTEILLPPLPEQKRIAAILDKADSLRRKRQQAMQLTDEFLRAVFLDMFGDPVMNPKGWKLATIDSLTSNWKGGAPLKPEDFTNEGFPVLHKGAIQRNGIIKIDTGKKTHTSAAFAKKYKNSVINKTFMAVTLRDLVPTGPSIGLMADLSDYETQEFVLAQGAYGFQINDKRMKPAYLVAVTNNQSFRKNLSKVWVGSTQIHIRNENYKGIEIPVPDFDLLCKYQEIADKTKSKVRRFELFENEAQQLFKSFSQKAFAGEL